MHLQRAFEMNTMIISLFITVHPLIILILVQADFPLKIPLPILEHLCYPETKRIEIAVLRFYILRVSEI